MNRQMQADQVANAAESGERHGTVTTTPGERLDSNDPRQLALPLELPARGVTSVNNVMCRAKNVGGA